MSGKPDPSERGPGFATRAIHDSELPGGIAEEPVSPPLWLTSDYLYESLDHYGDVMNERRPGYVYGRYGNPTHLALHRVMASLEGAESAWSFASGMAALHTTLTSLVQEGGRIVAQRTLYGGTFALLTNVFSGYGIRTTFVDPEADGVAGALEEEPASVVLVETLANPTFRVADVRGIAAACSERSVPLVVDNTIASPWLLRPLDIPGVTLVMHATSKYIGGHSDLIGGAVAGERALIDEIRHLAINQGTTAAAFESWLVLRGVQTLSLRMPAQCSSAMRLAMLLARHPKVASVGYSGLPDHADSERARELFGGNGYGAMLSFDMEGGYDGAARFADGLRVARVGSSFGGMKTEVCHPATTSHRQLSPEDRAAAGIGDGMLRVAVGGEDPDDLAEDFEQALEKA